MDAVLLFSHGSVLCGAEQNLLDVAARLDAKIVEVAFLNYNRPDFAEAVKRCVEQGATRIVVAPWFLVEGKFVVEDLPSKIALAREAHPNVEFLTADVIGFHPKLADAVLASAKEAREPSHWRRSIDDAGRWCRENPKCPLYGKPPCRVRAGR